MISRWVLLFAWCLPWVIAEATSSNDSATHDHGESEAKGSFHLDGAMFKGTTAPLASSAQDAPLLDAKQPSTAEATPFHTSAFSEVDSASSLPLGRQNQMESEHFAPEHGAIQLATPSHALTARTADLESSLPALTASAPPLVVQQPTTQEATSAQHSTSFQIDGTKAKHINSSLQKLARTAPPHAATHLATFARASAESKKQTLDDSASPHVAKDSPQKAKPLAKTETTSATKTFDLVGSDSSSRLDDAEAKDKKKSSYVSASSSPKHDAKSSAASRPSQQTDWSLDTFPLPTSSHDSEHLVKEAAPGTKQLGAVGASTSSRFDFSEGTETKPSLHAAAKSAPLQNAKDSAASSSASDANSQEAESSVPELLHTAASHDSKHRVTAKASSTTGIRDVGATGSSQGDDAEASETNSSPHASTEAALVHKAKESASSSSATKSQGAKSSPAALPHYVPPHAAKDLLPEEHSTKATSFPRLHGREANDRNSPHAEEQESASPHDAAHSSASTAKLGTEQPQDVRETLRSIAANSSGQHVQAAAMAEAAREAEWTIAAAEERAKKAEMEVAAAEERAKKAEMVAADAEARADAVARAKTQGDTRHVESDKKVARTKASSMSSSTHDKEHSSERAKDVVSSSTHEEADTVEKAKKVVSSSTHSKSNTFEEAKKVVSSSSMPDKTKTVEKAKDVVPSSTHDKADDVEKAKKVVSSSSAPDRARIVEKAKDVVSSSAHDKADDVEKAKKVMRANADDVEKGKKVVSSSSTPDKAKTVEKAKNVVSSSTHDKADDDEKTKKVSRANADDVEKGKKVVSSSSTPDKAKTVEKAKNMVSSSTHDKADDVEKAKKVLRVNADEDDDEKGKKVVSSSSAPDKAKTVEKAKSVVSSSTHATADDVEKAKKVMRANADDVEKAKKIVRVNASSMRSSTHDKANSKRHRIALPSKADESSSAHVVEINSSSARNRSPIPLSRANSSSGVSRNCRNAHDLVGRGNGSGRPCPQNETEIAEADGMSPKEIVEREVEIFEYSKHVKRLLTRVLPHCFSPAIFIVTGIGFILLSSDRLLESTRKRMQDVSDFRRMAIATLLLGIGTGFIGMFVAVLIQGVQLLGFTLHSMDQDFHHGGFFMIALHASPLRRFLSVTSGGLFGAFAWWWLRGREPAFVSVSSAMKGASMPVTVTTINAMIQDIVVALGGSFGREAAPRELAAMLGCRLGDAFEVAKEQRRVLVACGTGAGLAAVYSVPISGFFYTIEHVLEWDLSLGAMIPAIVTSCVATVVASIVIPDTGLYHIHLYSYDWPSLALLLSSAIIGPFVGIIAAIFVRLIAWARSYRPRGRHPVPFEKAKAGDSVTLSIPHGKPFMDFEEGLLLNVTDKTTFGVVDDRLVVHSGDERHLPRPSQNCNNMMAGSLAVIPRQDFRVVEKTATEIVVASPELKTDTEGKPVKWRLEMFEWEACIPEGARDNTILLVMPGAFLILALLSVKYPSLLGNGRALAQVAMSDHDVQIGRLVALFFLKAMVTAAAIGAGVDGGTLTPCVALGAVLGSVLHAFVPPSCPGGIPEKQALSVVAAAAFLASATHSPVTGLCLLMEFSAQGIQSKDIMAAFFGDFSGLAASKFALGMLAPMALAVAGATWSFRNTRTDDIHDILKPQLERFGNDMDIAPDQVVVLNKPTVALCVSCLHWSLRANACLTASFGAAARESKAQPVMLASFVGALAAAVGGAVVGLVVQLQSVPLCQQALPLVHEDDNDDSLPLNVNREWSVDMPPTCVSPEDPAMVAAYACVCSFLGATVPLAPWALGIGHEYGVTLATLLSTLFSLALSAGIAALRRDSETVGNTKFGWQGQVALTGIGILATWCVGLLYVMVCGQL